MYIISVLHNDCKQHMVAMLFGPPVFGACSSWLLFCHGPYLGKGQAEREIMTEFLREARIDASIHVSTSNFLISLTNSCGDGKGEIVHT